MFKPVAPQPNHLEIEPRIQRFWEEGKYFYRLMERNRGGPKFRFLDGPITANGPMGVHHAWGRTYKDLFQRYKAMLGFDQRFQNGFDCQGLWVEVEVEKELGFKSKRDIESFGIARFVEKCSERVLKFANLQTKQSILIGQWMDWKNSYYTMSDENNYTIWFFLKMCHQRGLIYEGTDVMPWCPRCGTAISDMEIATEGYRELVHPGVFLKFPIEGRGNECLLVWTTTPWTLTANTAAAVHPDLTYVKVKSQNNEEAVYILAKERLGVLGSDVMEGWKDGRIEGWEVIEEFLGKTLAGMKYRGPFDELPAQAGVDHRVVLWKDVSAVEGTGVVHIAPGCGKEDFILGKEEGLAVIAPLNEDGTFREGFDWLSGKYAQEVPEEMFANLRQKGLLHRVENYTHRYPVCWRCGEELVFRLVDEWFIAMDPLREEIMESARNVRWIPKFGLERELDWLRNMGDWCISKKRYWGLALPIYKCSCGWFDVIGSPAELKMRAKEGGEKFEGHSPHRPWVDEVKIACPKCSNLVSRIKDVGNPWLDAGIVPFSTTNYLTDRKYWQEWFPFDFITESFPGQFRNWFYAILTMSTVLEKCAPFRVVLGYATMKAEDGREMHKSWGNAIEVEEAVEKMGADVMRWLFIRHNPTQNLLFGFRGGEEVRRRLLTLWNVYSFFVTYANIDKINPAELKVELSDLSILDRWALSRLNWLVAFARNLLDEYDCASVAWAVEEFVDDLSIWFVRRSRRRFWKSANDTDKSAAYYTLYTCLVTLIKLIAPFMPFITEEIYQNLVRSCDPQAPESIFLCFYPEPDSRLIDTNIEEEMKKVRMVVSLGHSAREKAQIKVRQPLPRLLIRCPRSVSSPLILGRRDPHPGRRETEDGEKGRKEENQELTTKNQEPTGDGVFIPFSSHHFLRGAASGLIDLIKEELNVREVVLLKPEEPFPAGCVVQENKEFAVGIDTNLTLELEYEGLARELIRQVQTMRKAMGLEVTDRIILACEGTARLQAVINMFGDYIRQETLAVEIISRIGCFDSKGDESTAPLSATEIEKEVKINDEPCRLRIIRRKTDGKE